MCTHVEHHEKHQVFRLAWSAKRKRVNETWSKQSKPGMTPTRVELGTKRFRKLRIASAVSFFCGKKTVFKFILKPNRTFQTKRPNASSVVEYTRRRVVLVCKEENFFFPPRIVRVRLVTFGDITATAYRWKSTPGDNYY